MTATATVPMTVARPGAKPGVAQAAKALGVRPGAIDRSLGVISVDPSRNLHPVQIRAEDVPGTSDGGAFNGPFADPRIAPFGPPGN